MTAQATPTFGMIPTQKTRQEQALAAAKLVFGEPYRRIATFIDGSPVSTWGVNGDCVRFRRQVALVRAHGDSWPCVSINLSDPDPLDGISRSFSAPLDIDELLRAESDRAPSAARIFKL